MKRLGALLGIVLCMFTARAQNITAAEYFIDQDPGSGLGTTIAVPTPGTTVNLVASVATGSLPAGFHIVGIRTRDANGVWGLFESRGFYVATATADAANITAAEYFFDTDPGPGNGNALSVGTSGAVVNFTVAIPASLPAGFHFLAIRVRDANGIWGLLEKRGWYLSTTLSNSADIAAAEYFLDVDPGPGNGTALPIGSSGGVINFAASIPTAVAPGFHFLAIRVKGQDGIWGLYENRGFYVSGTTTDAGNIVAAEYFLDADPGPGHGTALAIGASANVVNFTASIPTSVSPGFHFLSIRVKGQDGTWGLYENRGFYVSGTMVDAANIVAAEYFFDADPGPGNGTAATVGASGSTVLFSASIPTSLSTGFHFLSIRVKGQDGVWGLFEKRGVYVSANTGDMPVITSAEYFFDSDPGPGNGTPLTIGTSGAIVTQTFSIPEPALSLGQHFLGIRVRDQAGNWGLYEYDTLQLGVSSISCPGNVTVNAAAGQCSAVVNNIDPVVAPPQAFTYTLTGATTGSGSGTASGQTFNPGVTTVKYTLTGSPTLNCSFTVTVNTNVVPAVTIGASATSICAGTPVTFTATPTNGGATPSFQWKLNGVNVGTNSSTYQHSTLANNDIVTVVMTSSLPCASPATATSNAVTMTVSTVVTPAVSIAASATSICSGTNVVFTATPAGGGSSPAFQWKLNGSNVGTNSATYQNATLANSDIVTVVMTSSLSCVSQATATSNAITMVVNPNVTPSVSIAASATTICSGSNVSFTATPVNGGATPAFQWKLNGANVGGNSASYQNSTLANGDVVTLVMASSATCAVPASVNSNSITMSVTTTVMPSVTITASATTICAGTNVTFTATPVNGGTAAYQWKLNGANVGTNSASYQHAALANGDVVTVAMTSSLSCVTQATAQSNAITMTVNAAVAPAVTIAASATTICAGTNVTFTASPVNGGTNPAYQWQVNGVNAGTNSPGFQSASLTNNDFITVVMTSSLACASPASAISGGITMTVTTPVTPAVSVAASATTICAGTTVTFTATPVNGGASPVYQWKLNGTNVGTNSPTYQNAGLVNGDNITVVITSSLSCVTQSAATSPAISISVTTPVSPAVSIAASATTVCAGTNVSFTATPVNGGSPAYQWKVNGVNAGTNSPSFQSTAFANSDVVTVVMTSSLSCVTQSTVTSNAVTLTVNPVVVPAVTIVASASAICSGSSVSFTATAVNGGATPSFQWKLNGNNVGTNAASFQSGALVNNDVVSVVMSSSASCVSPNTATSNAVTMSVTAPVTPSVAVAATATTICQGTVVTYTATPGNGGSPAYQWKLNGVNTGSNSATYQNATLANNDVVTVVMTTSLSCVTQPTAVSSPVVMTVATNQTWIGVASSDWNNAANWCGGIPTATTDVIIPATAPNMPVISGGTGTAHHISINAGGSLTIQATGVLDLFGNLSGNGSFNALAGSINFRGSSSQLIPGFVAAHVTLNGSGGVVLSGSATVSGTLTLTNGSVTLGSANLTLSASSNGSIASHIITNGSGLVIEQGMAANVSRTVPVGADALSYNPIVINANAGHVTDNLSVRVQAGVFVNGSSGSLFTDVVVNRMWVLSEAVPGGSDVNLTLQWSAGQELQRFDRNKCYVTQNINGVWQSLAPGVAGGSDPFTLTRNSVTEFSPVTVQTQPIPRPVKGIYPNPVKTVLNIVTEIGTTQTAIVSVYDATGRLVMREARLFSAGLSQNSINVERLAGGVYYLQIRGTETSKLLPTARFVKE